MTALNSADMLSTKRHEGEKRLVNETGYWLGFSLVPEIGPKRFALLYRAFGSASAAWKAAEPDLRKAGLEPAPLRSLLQWRERIDLEAEWRKVEQANARLITLEHDDYPALLKALPDAPPVLYVRGTLRPDDDRALAIVGTRKASTYGRDAARLFAHDLARQGITVVSGLAHGIDAAAHRGALEAGGRTIAVLGCGIDLVYPHDHKELAAQIAGRGALISEFPIGAKPEARNFPRRNRVISGMALGVLVVEAPEHSGALITASTAAEQGREVFAVPGNIFNAASSGANRLIQDGAKPVLSANDILDELHIAYRNLHARRTTAQIAPTTEIETDLLKFLSPEPIHIDELVRLSGFPINMVTSTLTLLELKGLARSVGPMQYSLEVTR